MPCRVCHVGSHPAAVVLHFGDSVFQTDLLGWLLQVVFSVAPQPLLEEFYSSFLSGDLPALASHPSANFALQAFLAAANRSPLVKHLLAELKGSFTDLLQVGTDQH